jgi:hypothetical protein
MTVMAGVRATAASCTAALAMRLAAVKTSGISRAVSLSTE